MPPGASSARKFQIDRKEITMSVVPPQDRLAGAWNFSAIHSAVTFSVAYVVASFRASFEEIAATLVDGKLSGAAEVASVDVKDENLAAHLMSAEFFDADNHAEGPTEDSTGNTGRGFTTKAIIDRTAYGVSWNADLPRGGRALSDDVELTTELEFIQAA
jgi:polyisoprenoid-binding protein YceI